MNDLLTVRQVQEVLKVDRITIYRMVQDGRLNGVKIGKQWRFSESEISNLFSGITPVDITMENGSQAQFPSHCIQLVQDVVCDLSDISCLMVDYQGNMVTEISRMNPFCKMVQSSPAGRVSCENCWKDISLKSAEGEMASICHAGLMYRTSPIQEDGRTIAYLLAGQFMLSSVDNWYAENFIEEQANKINLEAGSLLKAAATVPVYNPEKLKILDDWPVKITRVLEGIMEERTILLKRLRRIAEISAV